MAITRVNTASLNADSTSASAYSVTIPTGTGILAGDLLIVAAAGNGTHATNGMSVQDSVNTTNFTTIKETEQGASSTHWMQTFYFATPLAIADGSTITFTPYAGSTVNAFAVDIWRGTTGAITHAVTSQSNTAGTSQAAPALGSAPVPGDLVLTFDAATSGVLTPGAAFTAGSTDTTGQAVAIGYATPASGLSTYASTWTSTSSQTSAAQTVSFGSAQINAAYLIAANSFASGTTSTAVTAGAATGSLGSQVGDAVFVVATTGSGSVTVSNVTDSHSQSYAPVGSFTPGNGLCSYIYALYGSGSALVSGTDTVTVTWSSTSNAKSVTVVGCSNVATSAALDQDNGASGTSAAPAVTTSAGLSTSGELALSVIIGGSASVSATPSTGWTQLGSTLRVTGGVYTAVAWQVPSSTGTVTAGATLGVSAAWSAQVATFTPSSANLPAPAAAVTVTNASPLPAGQIGVAYSDQLNATGGTPPYTWSSTGTIPPGLTLEPGTTGGGGGDVRYVGANCGPQGGPTLAQLQQCAPVFGPIGTVKYFYSAGGTGIYTGYLGGNVNGGSWTTGDSGTPGYTPDTITKAFPGTFINVNWGALMSAAAINTFVASIPHSVAEVGFCFQQEMEAAYGIGNGAQFVKDWTDQATKIRAAQANTPVKLTLIVCSIEEYYQSGQLTNASFMPPANVVDVYGLDFYDRFGYWAGPDMSTNAAWKVWSGLVKGFGKPLALTEYGISGATAAQQNTRLQADWTYIKAAFGTGGSVSQLPLYIWLYWNTDGTSLSTTVGKGNKNQMISAAAQQTWAGIAATQSGGSGGAGGGGGLLHGTPTTATGSPFSFTAKATDSTGANGTKTFSLTIGSASTLAITNTSPLPGGTVGTAYSNLLTASGGTPPYTWTTTVGSPPNGIGLGSGGLLTGTPTVAGTSSATYQVTDSASLTATASLSITIASGLSLTTTSLPGAALGTAYTATLVATGGTSPYTWAVIAGALPDGLTLDPVAGVISGTPTGTSASFTVAVTDSANTTVSQQYAISVTGSGGGSGPSPTVGRRRFGGGISDFTISESGTSFTLVDTATVMFFDSLTGGNQYTDLTDTSGNAITTVVSDSNGEIPEFYGPSGIWKMAADGNGGAGPRRWMIATDMGDEVTALVNGNVGLSPLGGVVPGGVPVWNGVTWQNQLITDASVDPAAAIEVSKLQAGANQAPLLTSGTTPAWVSPAQGTVTLNGATAVVVAAAAVTANSRIFLTIQSPAGTPGSPYVSARTAGVSFSVKSQAADTSTCAWFILEPGT